MLLPGSAESYQSPTRLASGQAHEERRIGHLSALREAVVDGADPGLLDRLRTRLLTLRTPATTLTSNTCCTA